MLMSTYEDFNEETQIYLNKAMDIYSTIMNKHIQKKVNSLHGEKDYIFSENDKKILSLYIASFLFNGNLKNILNRYGDIEIRDLFSFININENDIKPLENREYSEFYEKNFDYLLRLLKIKKSRVYDIKEITPEVIYWFMDEVEVNGSDILNYLCKACKLKYLWLCDHASFKEVKLFAETKGSIKKQEIPKLDFNRPLSNDSKKLIDKFIKNQLNLPLKTEYSIPQETLKLNKTIDFEDEKIWDILDEIQKKFIGQETAAEYLFYNIVNNQQLFQRDDISDGERAIIFLDGPTGTGKTAITRDITEKLDIPFTSSSITNYSSTGYVGGNITDTLKELYKKANGNLEKAQRGIIVFDEFDKLSYNRHGGLEMKKAVQQQLLDFMGGGKYKITVGNSMFDIREIEFDTSKLTFICLAALTDLRTHKTDKKQPIGFGNSHEENETYDYDITPKDLIEEIGLERELVGRFNTYLHTEQYSKESLLKILKESTISPIIGFKKWIESKGKKLVIEDGVYEAIAEAAYELNTGARGLQTVMNNIRTPFIKEVLRGKNEVINLTLDTVININKSVTSRKGR